MDLYEARRLNPEVTNGNWWRPACARGASPRQSSFWESPGLWCISGYGATKQKACPVSGAAPAAHAFRPAAPSGSGESVCWPQAYRRLREKALGLVPMARRGFGPSLHTVCHLLHRQGFLRRKKECKTLYTTHWAWEESWPLTLVQVDVKDIRDKATLRIKLWD